MATPATGKASQAPGEGRHGRHPGAGREIHHNFCCVWRWGRGHIFSSAVQAPSPGPSPKKKKKVSQQLSRVSNFLRNVLLRQAQQSVTVYDDAWWAGFTLYFLFNRSSLKGLQNYTNKNKKKETNWGLFFSVKVCTVLPRFSPSWLKGDAQCMLLALATAIASWISRITRIRVSICSICSLLIGWTEYQIGLLGATTGSGVR